MKDLVIKAQNGDKQAVKILWDKVKRLAYKKCLKWYNHNPNRFIRLGLTIDDLKQECYIAMVECLEHYKNDRGRTFGSYYYNYFVTKALSELAGLRNKKDKLLLDIKYIDESRENQEEYTLLDIIEDDTAVQDFEEVEHKIKIKQLHTVLDEIMTKELSENEKQVIENTYYKNLTLKHTGMLINKSIERVRQIQCRALRKMSKPQYERILVGYLYYDVDMTSLAYKTPVERTAEKLEKKRQEQDRLWKEYLKNRMPEAYKIIYCKKTAG